MQREIELDKKTGKGITRAREERKERKRAQ